MKLQEIIAAVQEYHPEPDLDLLRRSYSFVHDKHLGQTRASGEPYITHVSEVAFLATKLKLDVHSIAAAFLHDTVEDTNVTLEDLRKEFGADISDLVDGVTKLNQVNFSSKEEAQAENFRKMLLAMARDIRVLLIKLCDRTHNMRTLEFLSEARQARIAQETMDIYAPLAHRLGIYWMKSELEDLSFRYLKANLYNDIKSRVNQKKKERERYIKEVADLLNHELAENNISGVVSGRAKHFFSIYQKMEKYGLSFNEIYDLIAFRIMVPSSMDCYAALGVVHAAWKPIPGRFKDYIAMPKANGYQSLHTTVIGPQGARIEIQIRTQEMHDIAERGIAAHWIYKEDKDGKRNSNKRLQLTWLQDLVETEKSLRDPMEFISLIKEDLFPQEVYVFSPKGDLIALSAGSTPIDFAYQIHTDVGTHCLGARVNGQQVPLAYKLKNGDTVEITTSPSQTPSKDWLSVVASSKAKQRIRAWLKVEERKRSVTVGRELLGKDLRRVDLSLQAITKDGSLDKVAKDLGVKDSEALVAEIGYGKISTSSVLAKLLPEETNLEEKLKEDQSALRKIFNRAARVFKEKNEVKVSGLDDLVYRYAHCCEPLPGDILVGYVTRGRGVTIHKRNCTQTLGFDPRRVIDVVWEEGAKAQRRVKLKVLCIDAVGMLASITQSISTTSVSIVAAQVTSTGDGKAILTFEITVESAQQLDQLTRGLEGIKGVMSVERSRRAP